jgi:hypothetical protein
VNTQSLTYNLLAGILRLALVLALVFTGLSIYRKLPGDSATDGSTTAAQTALLIVLEPAPEDGEVAMNIPIELYPIDLSAAQREYLSERRPGVRFDDFLAHKLGDHSGCARQVVGSRRPLGRAERGMALAGHRRWSQANNRTHARKRLRENEKLLKGSDK